VDGNSVLKKNNGTMYSLTGNLYHGSDTLPLLM